MRKGKLMHMPMRNAYGNTIVIHAYRFTSEEKDYIYANYRSMSGSEMGKVLNRSRSSVLAFMQRHRLFKKDKSNA